MDSDELLENSQNGTDDDDDEEELQAEIEERVKKELEKMEESLKKADEGKKKGLAENPVDKSKDRFPPTEHKDILDHYLEALTKIAVSICKDQDEYTTRIQRFEQENIVVYQQFYFYLQDVKTYCKRQLDFFQSMQKQTDLIRAIDLNDNEEQANKGILVGYTLLQDAYRIMEPESVLPVPTEHFKQYPSEVTHIKKKLTANYRRSLFDTLFMLANGLVLMCLFSFFTARSITYYFIGSLLLFYTVAMVIQYRAFKKDRLISILDTLKTDMAALETASDTLKHWITDEITKLAKTQKSALFVFKKDPKDQENYGSIRIETDGAVMHIDIILSVHHAIYREVDNLSKRLECCILY
ncbi:hypothetical protein A0J61_05314 [Choanephora cucurbitarum]|uniref:Uncharacterized protein n=1 Tax=Choanephora cucurbitarum TaxID=101091 RepID=A0A1C7NCE1_9FUNG|nr:hypothetical protein A0J61_05314 [Choanephora cucurbitarum]